LECGGSATAFSPPTRIRI